MKGGLRFIPEALPWLWASSSPRPCFPAARPEPASIRQSSPQALANCDATGRAHPVEPLVSSP